MCDATIRRSNVLPRRNLGIEGKRSVSRWVVQGEKLGKSDVSYKNVISRSNCHASRTRCSESVRAPRSATRRRGGIRETSQTGSDSRSPARPRPLVRRLRARACNHCGRFAICAQRCYFSSTIGFGTERRGSALGVQLSRPVVRATEDLIVDDTLSDVASEELVPLSRDDAVDDAGVAAALLAAPARRSER